MIIIIMGNNMLMINNMGNKLTTCQWLPIWVIIFFSNTTVAILSMINNMGNNMSKIDNMGNNIVNDKQYG